jgi:hypothetical protein
VLFSHLFCCFHPQNPKTPLVNKGKRNLISVRLLSTATSSFPLFASFSDFLLCAISCLLTEFEATLIFLLGLRFAASRVSVDACQLFGELIEKTLYVGTRLG